MFMMAQWIEDAGNYGNDLVYVIEKLLNEEETMTKADYIVFFEARNYFDGLGPESYVALERIFKELGMEFK